jgi:hypothetical protein
MLWFTRLSNGGEFLRLAMALRILERVVTGRQGDAEGGATGLVR